MIRRCPHCESECDGHTFTDGTRGAPRPGDLSVCLECSVALVFTESMQLRPLEVVEWVKLSSDQREALGQATALVAMYRLYGPKGVLRG